MQAKIPVTTGPDVQDGLGIIHSCDYPVRVLGFLAVETAFSDGVAYLSVFLHTGPLWHSIHHD